MKLKVIVDNNTFIDEYYCGEPANAFDNKRDETGMISLPFNAEELKLTFK